MESYCRLKFLSRPTDYELNRSTGLGRKACQSVLQVLLKAESMVAKHRNRTPIQGRVLEGDACVISKTFASSKNFNFKRAFEYSGYEISWTSHSMTEATAVIRDQSGYINEFDESLQFTGRLVMMPYPAHPETHISIEVGLDDFADDEPDFDIVVGGWTDARRDDAVEETRNLLKDAQIFEQVEEIWAPYSRTSFVKLRILFDPAKPMSLGAKRSKQKELLDRLKSKQYLSGIPGSEKKVLWATRSKTPEERLKTRAIVLTKEFYSNLPHVDPTKKDKLFAPHNIDIIWTGKVYIGRHQLLGNVHRDGEPSVNDFLLSDSRGNHLEWYLLAKPFAELTGRSPEDLQDTWDKHGPSSRSQRE
ncbi:unnamed protein product [Symbiodinium sp. KB8]|nr:unnamed protein product [Symbiodinium sp. KB8]